MIKLADQHYTKTTAEFQSIIWSLIKLLTWWWCWRKKLKDHQKPPLLKLLKLLIAKKQICYWYEQRMRSCVCWINSNIKCKPPRIAFYFRPPNQLMETRVSLCWSWCTLWNFKQHGSESTACQFSHWISIYVHSAVWLAWKQEQQWLLIYQASYLEVRKCN